MRHFIVELGTYSDDVAGFVQEKRSPSCSLNLRDGHICEYPRPVSINGHYEGREVPVEIVPEVVLPLCLHLG